MTLLEKAKTIKWERFGKWLTPVLMDVMYMGQFSAHYLKELGLDRRVENLFTLDGEYYWPEEEHQAFLAFFRNALKKQGVRFLRDFRDIHVRNVARTTARIDNLREVSIKGLDTDQLLVVFKEFMEIPKSSMGLNYFFILLEEALYNFVKQLFGSDARMDVLLGELTPPKQPAHVIQEEEDLLKIAIKVSKQGASAEELIRTHKAQYAWLASLNWNVPLYDDAYFLDRLSNFLKNDPERLLAQRMTEREKREKHVAAKLEEINASQELRQAIDLLRDLMDVRLAQWDTVSLSGYYARPLLSEIGNRLGLSYDEVIELSPQEIEDGLKGKPISKGIIVERKKHKAVLKIGDNIELYQGDQAAKFRETVLKEDIQAASDTLKGITAHPGIARGIIRIIPTPLDLSKMQQGEILVCPMTNPDYMPAIRKAAGIVTDQGGILCHAAIVSREFKIPCIIGTKIATKIFKDGDKVEVDADKGIVRKM